MYHLDTISDVLQVLHQVTGLPALCPDIQYLHGEFLPIVFGIEQLAGIFQADIPLYPVPAQLHADPADVHAHRMGEQLPPAGDAGVHLPLEQGPVQVGPLAPYLQVIEHVPFLLVQLMPQDRAQAAAP